MPTVRKIPFRNIPGHSRLFLEYLDLEPSALGFYQHPPALAGLGQLARAIHSGQSIPRSPMSDILRRQNAALGSGERTATHIEEFQKDDCVVIMTGQQVGMFGGPLYTAHKALTVLSLTRKLRDEGVRAVPVFWMECEDHDLAEITHGTVLAADGSVQKLDFAGRLFGETKDSARPVGSIRLPDSIGEVVAEYISALPPRDFGDGVRTLLAAAYTPGAGMADSFGRLMANLFKNDGLILFNPRDVEAKQLVRPIFRQAVLQADPIFALLRERTSALEGSGYHAQVSIPDSSTVLFIQEEGERRALLRSDRRFLLKHTGRYFAQEELLQMAETNPEVFSPNVLLRPVVQDSLFPTLVYVGGPAEIAYFAQTEVLYRHFGRPMPVIWPRNSFTMIEPEVASAMRRGAVRFEDCLEGKQRVLERLIETARSSSAGECLKKLREEIEQTVESVRPAMAAADPSLGPALETARRKMQHNIDSLYTRFVQFELSRDKELGRIAERIANCCLPGRSLQERELGVAYFLNRYGPEILEMIGSRIELGEFKHLVLDLP